MPGSRVDEDGTEIIDVGLCRAATDEITECCKEGGRIVVGEEGGGIAVEGCAAHQCVGCHDRAGRVGGVAASAVDAVGVRCQRMDAGRTAQRKGECQGIFLVGATGTCAA